MRIIQQYLDSLCNINNLILTAQSYWKVCIYFINIFCLIIYYNTSFAVKLQLMRKFQEWHDNQTYFMHLSNLSLIRSRKPPTSVNLKRRAFKQNRSLSQQQIDKANKRMIKRIQNPKRIAIVPDSDYFKPTFSKEKYKVYQKNLISQNFLFGNRILNAEPVISTTKMQKQYEIRKLVKAPRTNNTSWSIRSVKLKEFLNNDEPSLHLRGYGKHILKLKILDIQLYKQRLQEDMMHNISLTLEFGKSIRHSSFVPVKLINNHEFCFKFGKKPSFDGSVRAHVRYHNGIKDVELGYFDFSIGYYFQGKSAPEFEQQQIYKRVGTYGGRVVFSTSASKIDEYHQ